MENVEKFKQWALKLGCPANKIPSDDVLKRTIRGNQLEFFQKLMTNIRPRQEADHMRKTVLIHKLRQYKEMGSVASSKVLSKMPAELQRYETMGKLRKRYAELQTQIQKSQTAVETTKENVRANNIRKLQLERKLEETRDTNAVLHAYKGALLQQSQKDVAVKQKLDRVMFAKDGKWTRDDAEDAVARCWQLLEEFYESFKDAQQEGSQRLQQKLWSDIRKELHAIPNHLLWSVLIDKKGKQLQAIVELHQQPSMIDEEKRLSDADQLRINIAKLCTMHVNLFLENAAIKRDTGMVRQEYMASFTASSELLEAKMLLANEIEEEVEETLEEFLLQSNSKEYNQAQIEFMQKELEWKKQEIKVLEQKVENHEQLLGQIRSIYGNIDTVTERMQEEIQQLGQVRDKITYSQNFSRYMVHNMRQKNASNTTLSFADQTVNFSRLDNTTLSSLGPQYTPPMLPAYDLELSTFRSIPFAKFTQQSKARLLYLEPNPVLFLEPSLNPALLPGNTALTAHGTLQQLHALLELDARTKSSLDDVKVDTFADMELAMLEQHWTANDGPICQLLDETEKLAKRASKSLDKVSVYMKVLLDNTLSKYVPRTKLFNGRSYNDYETEYKTYYRMIYGTYGISK